MLTGYDNRLKSVRARLAVWCTGPAVLAFIPALCLASFWMGGETALVAVCLGVPLLVILVNPDALHARSKSLQTAQTTLTRGDFDAVAANVHANAGPSGKASAIFLLEISDFDDLVERHGQRAGEHALNCIAERLPGVLRDADSVAQVSDARFAVCLGLVQHLDLEACIELSGRMQTAIEEPVSLGGVAIYVSAAVGFCQLNRAPENSSAAWLEAAEIALQDAQMRGPTAIRAFSDQVHKTVVARLNLRQEASEALDSGQIQPWFQPQISTDTGQVTGFEALARWTHPERGLISPNEFLPALEEVGLMDRLGEVMLFHSLTALKAWDNTGIEVPRVGVNFSDAELNNPRLIERVEWELDRFDMDPDRLSVEILETVVSSSPGDTVVRNVKALEAMGCRIDLDDFGTGNASIAAIRRFNVCCIKIDRSFVMKADRDPEQRRMIAAILTMAERLGIETVAEGVETVGEHALLSQLGCTHVQGFGIGRPMPFEKTVEWIELHKSKLNDPPKLPHRKAGG